MQFCGARDWNNPRLLGKKPGERYLSGCRSLPLCGLAKQFNQGLIRFPSLRRKAREDVAEVGAVERGVFVDLSREEALAQRAIWNEADSEFLKGRQHFRFWPSRPQRVFALDCSDRLDSMCASNRLRSCFRKPEVFHLTLPNQVLHRSRHVFDRDVWINTVLIEQINDFDLESLERGLGDLLDVLWPTIQPHPTRLSVGLKFESELGGDHHLLTEGGEGFAHEFFVRERAVNFSCIEECDAAFDG